MPVTLYLGLDLTEQTEAVLCMRKICGNRLDSVQNEF